MAHTLTYRAHDNEIVSFKVPAGCNRWLIQKAIERAHRGDEAALVDFGLTRAEVEFVAEVVGTLEEHKRKAGAAQ